MKQTATIQLRINDDLKKDVVNRAKDLNITVSALVKIAIIEKLNRLQEGRR